MATSTPHETFTTSSRDSEHELAVDEQVAAPPNSSLSSPSDPEVSKSSAAGAAAGAAAGVDVMKEDGIGEQAAEMVAELGDKNNDGDKKPPAIPMPKADSSL